MRVLLIEDDKRIANFVAKGLREMGHEVLKAADGPEGMHLALNELYDVVVIDVMLPGMDGLTLVESMRGQGITTPVLILSAKREVDDRVQGFLRGGDDYLTKPFAFAELHVRLLALVRRVTGHGEVTRVVVGDLTVDLLRHEVVRRGQKITLSPREYALLEYLAKNAGRPVSKTMIMEGVWGYDFDPQANVVEARICFLRDKIDKGFDRPLIHTIRGVGYVLKADV